MHSSPSEIYIENFLQSFTFFSSKSTSNKERIEKLLSFRLCFQEQFTDYSQQIPLNLSLNIVKSLDFASYNFNIKLLYIICIIALQTKPKINGVHDVEACGA
jgi:hypothetical protein